MATNNKVNVTLSFNADTGNAKKQIADLQKSLANMASYGTVSVGQGIDKGLSEAVATAGKLGVVLKNSLNVKTGNLDTGKFQENLKKTGLTIDNVRENLLQMGPDGERAFRQLTRAVLLADEPIKRTNKLVEQLKTTMKNVVTYQVTTSMYRSITGAIQKAYNYAEDLNKSLNNIRIVTGYSADKMADFAKEANKAAQVLSTTTTAYTDAALIFFQQGKLKYFMD